MRDSRVMLHFVTEYDPSTEGFDAGFKINLNNELIHHPNSTYLVQMDSSELHDNHILAGDVLVVDRALDPKNNDLILAYLNGEKIVRYYEKTKNSIVLYNARDNVNTPYTLQPKDVFEIFGVVINLLRRLRKD